jgi:hypothetical protein
MRRIIVVVLLLLFFTGQSTSFGWECGKAPPAKQVQRRKSGEGFPPLPLPVTPLRRSEKKNPPAPPVLVGKVICGSEPEWTRAENDVENLLKIASAQLNIPYRAVKVNLSNFSFDPDEIPVLYITSVEPYKPDEKILQRLKGYLESGGFIWANASSGSPEFTKNLVQILGNLYPDRNLYTAYDNHPLKGCFHNLSSVKILNEGKESTADLDIKILNLGCRAAIIFSPIDLGCGWAMHTHPWGKRYMPEDAIKIGINILTYTLGWIQFGRLYGLTPIYAETTEKKSGKLYIGQLIHSGDWDPHPSSLGKILKRVAEETQTAVYLEKINVDLKKDTLENIPLLYITGHFAPNLNKEEKQKLRQFLLSGGSIIADSCCGSSEFTESFRKLMKEILPEGKIVKWDINHPLYKVPFAIDRFLYTFENNQSPFDVYLINGLPAVVFSPYNFGSGWEGIPRPYVKGIENSQSFKLGVNVITYLMTY